MCYSAQIAADYKKYVAMFGAQLSLAEFYKTFWERNEATSASAIKIPKALEDGFFAEPVTGAATEAEREIHALIATWRSRQRSRFEQELFKQRKRLADAQRSLQTRPTKAAQDSARIATGKVQQLMGWLADLNRREPLPRDARIYPGHIAPVMVWEDGRRVIKPMRYQCRPAGKPASYDRQYPGTYNARRDNLDGFWKGQWGHTHGLLLVDAFYENVARHVAEHRPLADGETPENLILEFRPRTGQPMAVACLWSRWRGADGSELLSFAAITDEPPPEVAAAGHDRCIIPIAPRHIDAWLQPQGQGRQALQTLLDERERPYYEHRLAA